MVRCSMMPRYCIMLACRRAHSGRAQWQISSLCAPRHSGRPVPPRLLERRRTRPPTARTLKHTHMRAQGAHLRDTLLPKHLLVCTGGAANLHKDVVNAQLQRMHRLHRCGVLVLVCLRLALRAQPSAERQARQVCTHTGALHILARGLRAPAQAPV